MDQERHAQGNWDSALLADIVQSNQDGLWVTDASHRIILVNPAMEKIAGVSAKDILGRSVKDDFPPETTAAFLRYYDQSAHFLMQIEYEVPVTTPSGRGTIQAGRLTPIIRGDVFAGMICTVRDITEEKNTVQELERIRAEQAAILDAAADHVLLLDDQFRIRFANRPSPGLSMDDLLGAHLPDLAPEEERPNVERVLKRAVEDGVPGRYETTYALPAGGQIVYESRVNPIPQSGKGHATQLVLTARDITAQKKTEAELVEAALQVSEAVRAASVGLWDWDLQDNTVRYSDEWKRIIGYDPHEIGDSIDEWRNRIHPEDADRVLGEVLACIRQTRQDYSTEFRFRHKDGTYRWILATASVFTDSRGTPVRMRGSQIDITERILSQQKLQETLRMSDDIVRTIPSGLYIYQYEEPNKLFLLSANPAAEELTGVGLADFEGMEFNDIWPNAQAAGITSLYLNVIKTGMPLLTEDLVYEDDRISGAFNIRAFRLPGNRLAVSFENITERKRTEEELARSEENYRTIFDSANDAILLHDPETGRILDANAQVHEIYGYTAEEILHVSIEDVSSGDEPYVQSEAVGRILKAAKGTPQTFDWHARRRDGTLFWVEVNLRKVDLLGESVVLAVVRDITERKTAEEELRASELRFRSIAEQMSGVIFLTDEIGTITYLSPGAVGAFGLPIQAMLGHHFQDFLGRDDVEKAKEAFTESIEEGRPTVRLELRMVNADGEEFVGELTGRPYEVDGSIGTIGMIQDITDRKRVEQRFEIAASVASDLIYEWDVLSDDLHWFGDIDGALGFEPGEIAHDIQSWIGLIHPDSRSNLATAVEFHRKHTEPILEEYRVRTKDGEWRHWIDQAAPILGSEGKPIRWIGVCNDITERVRAQEALRESEEALRLTFSTIAEGITVTNLQGEIEQSNQAASDIFGYASPAETVGRNVLDFVAEKDRQRAVLAMDQTLEEGTSDVGEFELLRKDGTTFPGEIHGKILRDASGSPMGFVITSRDVSDRRKAEQQLRAHAARLRELRTELDRATEDERRRIARELHDQVSQNLTALSITAGSVGKVISDALPQAENHVRECMKLIEETAEQIRSLTFDLRPPVLDDFGLVAAIKWHVARMQARSGLKVNVRGEEPKPRLPGRAEMALFRIVQEALTNVTKHAATSEASIEVSFDENTLTIRIEDKGGGFEQASSEDGGISGWGLLNMRERADAVGGTLTVESKPGQGTQVAVEVPR